MTATPTVYQQVVKARTAADVLVRTTARAGDRTYQFLDSDTLMPELKRVLSKYKILTIPVSQELHVERVNSGTWSRTTAKCTWQVVGPAGDRFEGQASGSAVECDGSGAAAAQTKAYRTFMVQLLSIATSPAPTADAGVLEIPVPGEDRITPMFDKITDERGREDAWHQWVGKYGDDPTALSGPRLKNAIEYATEVIAGYVEPFGLVPEPPSISDALLITLAQIGRASTPRTIQARLDEQGTQFELPEIQEALDELSSVGSVGITSLGKYRLP